MTLHQHPHHAGYAAIAGGALGLTLAPIMVVIKLWCFSLMMIACGWTVVAGRGQRLRAGDA